MFSTRLCGPLRSSYYSLGYWRDILIQYKVLTGVDLGECLIFYHLKPSGNPTMTTKSTTSDCCRVFLYQTAGDECGTWQFLIYLVSLVMMRSALIGMVVQSFALLIVPLITTEISQCIHPCFYLSIHSGTEAEVVFRVCLDFTTCSEHEEKMQFPSRTLGINYTFN